MSRPCTHPYRYEQAVLLHLEQVRHTDLVRLEHVDLELTIHEVNVAVMVADHQLPATARTRRDVHILTTDTREHIVAISCTTTHNRI
jgi:hypothetical protein